MIVQRTGEHPATVTAAHTVTPLLRRLELDAPTLPVATLLQDVAVVLHDGVVRRRYTVRDARPGRLALEAVLHGHGPGAVWAAAAQPGDQISLYGPRGQCRLPAADRYLLLADESGLPAVLELLTALAGRAVTAVVEVSGPDEQQPGLAIEWCHRRGRPAGEPDALLEVARRWRPRPTDAAFVLAESRVVAALRTDLLAAGVPRANLHAKGYWNRDDPRHR